MVYAVQISPEAQMSPIFIPECFPENIAVYGNRSFREHLPETFKRVREVLDNGYLEDVICDPDNYSYKNVTEAISAYLPPDNRSRYASRDICRLKKLVLDYPKARNAGLLLLEVLSIVTGMRWETSTIRGSCQQSTGKAAHRCAEDCKDGE